MTAAEGLPDDFEGRDMIARYADNTAVAAALVETKKALSSKVEDYVSARGAQSVDELKLPEGVNDATKSTLEKVRQGFFEKKGTVGQWDDLVTNLSAGQEAALAQRLESTKEQEAAWRAKAEETYGAKFEEVHALAKEAFDKIALDNPDLGTLMESTGLGSHPAMLDMFHQVASLTAQGRTPTGVPSEGGVDAQSIKNQTLELTASEAYRDKRHVAHKKAIGEYKKLIGALVDLGYDGPYDRRLEVKY